MSAVKAGIVIADRYRVDGRLGQGGMGVVYLGTQLGLQRPVAIKMLLPDLSERPEDRDRFHREARVMSRLRHENAVEIFDYGEWNGRLFLVMELLRGAPLRDRMTDGEPMPIDVTLELGWQLAEVLFTAHDLSLVHRDLKPENVVMEPRTGGTERAVVVDFGLAFIQSADADVSRLTAKGLVSGTPLYMSPEQARGLASLGPPTDVYSLGAMLYELAVGDPPFSARKTIDMVNQHLFVAPQPMRKRAPDLPIPPAFDDLVMRMLQKSAFDRPTAEEVRDLLAQLIIGNTPRGRGRPEFMNNERRRRMMTKRDAAPASGDRSDELVMDVDLAIHGEVNSQWLSALGAAGFNTLDWTPQCAADAVFVANAPPDDLSEYGGRPVLALVADDKPLPEIMEMMRAGIADVVRVSAPADELTRKVRRAVDKHRRRGLDARKD